MYVEGIQIASIVVSLIAFAVYVVAIKMEMESCLVNPDKSYKAGLLKDVAAWVLFMAGCTGLFTGWLVWLDGVVK